MDSVELDDKVRAWYDARDCGPLSRSHPFQSALCTSSLLESKKSSDRLEDALVNFCKGMTTKRKLSVSTVDLQRVCIKKSDGRISTRLPTAPSMTDTIVLADDLYASNEALSKVMLSAQKEEMDRYKTTMASQIEEIQAAHRRMLQSNAAPNAVDPPSSSAAPSSLANRFRSAKDQFTSEGGQLNEGGGAGQGALKKAFSNGAKKNTNAGKEDQTPLPPELEGYDRELVEKIIADIIDKGHPVSFSDISGLEFAKKCVTELICWPMSRPDLFQGLRALPRGLLLFGPPGTGKTLIGKAIAHQSGATFFSISASSLMSKWIGEGEKTVRTLFAVAAHRQPSVVFMDEVDSLLCQRSSDENEATRRIKTEFMVQLDGAGTSQTARVVIVGATNRPEELDEAVRRRFVKRIYIPLPDPESRRQLLCMLLGSVTHGLSEAEVEDLVKQTDGYSGADIRALCQEAAMGPVREVAVSSSGDLQRIDALSMPPISLAHFAEAFEAVLPSVSAKDLHRYVQWNNEFGSFRRMV